MSLGNKGRIQRWTAKGKARVTHPDYGSVIVPHMSNFAALENAAEFWKCDVREIMHTAKVEWVAENEGPVRRPREFYKKKEESHEPGTTDEPV